MRLWNLWQSGLPNKTERSALPCVGETVRLHVAKEGHFGVYRARVRALGLRRIFLDSAEASVSADSLEGDAAPRPALPLRTSLTLSYIRADSLYQFETRIVSQSKPGSLIVARPRIVTRLQRRQFYRLPLQSPTTFRVRGDTLSTAPIPARLVNLSGGGALLASAKPVPGGLRLAVRIPTGKQGALEEIEADALDCRVASQGLGRIYLVRLRFLGPPDLTDESREEIIAYIFEQQRLLLRNRKLLRT